MKKILIKILLKIIGEDPFSVEAVDLKIMQNWLFDSYKNNGYKQYYTRRKKYILNELGVGMEQKDYWKKIGRIEELKALNENINTEVERRNEERNKMDSKDKSLRRHL